MSKDIRSYFTVLSKKSGTDSKKALPPSLSTKKKVKKLIDSDDEDVIAGTPEKTPQKKKLERRSVMVLSSDSEDEKIKKKTPQKSEAKENSSKLKPVSVVDVFKNVPIKQSEVQKAPLEKKEDKESKKSKSKKKKVGTELGVHNDSTFEKTLLQLDDDDDIFENLDVPDKSEIIEYNKEISETKTINDDKEGNKNEINNDKDENEGNKKEINGKDENDSNEIKKGERKRSRNDSSSDKNTPKKKKIEHTDSGIDPGQEAFEKKRYSAMLYQKYLNRSGPKHHGMKEKPKGEPDCLTNLCFLKTGVLDSLETEEFENLIKEHGGRVVHAVSRKVNYVVIGEDPGPAKLAKAESFNIPNINEDELFDLILTKSGMEPKYCKKDTSLSSEDLGIEIDKQPKTSPEMKKTEKKREEQNKSVEPSTSKAPKNTPDPEIDSSLLTLTEKYKPKDLKGIIGQQSEGSNMFKLRTWLQNWHKNQDPKVRKTLLRPSPWAKKDDGSYFKCALLSGPPGVGKTTTATLVAKDLGLDIVEFNASDTRSKKLLHQEVSQLLSSKTIAGFATGQSNVSKNRVLLMDEVDGMAGNEDRGGIQELIQLIKNTNVPIICMCNDRNHQKMRSLVNYCFDLRFTKPRVEQIRGAMMSICFKEGITIQPNALAEVISGTGCDVRQTLNHLAIMAAGSEAISLEVAEREAKASKKDTIMGPWEVCRAVFTRSEHKNMSLADKARLFFYDYSIGPLFVQENYLKVQPDGNKRKNLLKAALAADSISMGDVIDSKIRRTNNWSLLESQAMCSSVLPGHYMSGHFAGQINFPAWLGKNSKKNKFGRIVSEIQAHTRTSASASKLAIKLDYLVHLKNAIVLPLKKKGMDGVDQAVEVMKCYNLLREDFDGLLELCQWQRGENSMGNIDSKVKSAFTRTYNKKVKLLPYSLSSGVTKKKASAAESDIYGEEEEVETDVEEEEDISKNAMIKVKKPANKRKKDEDEAGSGKKAKKDDNGTSKKGRGKKTK